MFHIFIDFLKSDIQYNVYFTKLTDFSLIYSTLKGIGVDRKVGDKLDKWIGKWQGCKLFNIDKRKKSHLSSNIPF